MQALSINTQYLFSEIQAAIKFEKIENLANKEHFYALLKSDNFEEKTNATIKIMPLDTAKKILLILLKNAIKIEHATIPPYLTALYSIKPDTNIAVRQIINDIVIEEMLHMLIASNLYVIYGGTPKFYDQNLLVQYPNPLPILDQDFKVPLTHLSEKTISEVFMKIEMPVHPQSFPSYRELEEANSSPLSSKKIKLEDIVESLIKRIKNIGDYYRLISIFIKILPFDETNHNIHRQLVDEKYFGKKLSFLIDNKQKAIDAIDLIIEQGEGKDKDKAPTALGKNGNEIAHYYRFEQILKRHELIADKNTKTQFSYSGKGIPFSQEDIFKFSEYEEKGAACTKLTRQDLEKFPEDLDLIDQFNQQYCLMLKNLEKIYQSDKGDEKNEHYTNAITCMHVMSHLANKIVQRKNPIDERFSLRPTFEFVELPEL